MPRERLLPPGETRRLMKEHEVRSQTIKVLKEGGITDIDDLEFVLDVRNALVDYRYENEEIGEGTLI